MVDEATARRRALIAGVLAALPPRRQQAVAAALREFAGAAGEVPDSEWPAVPARQTATRGAGE